MLNSYAKLEEWIKKNTKKKDRGDAKTIADAAIWFVCVQEADCLRDMSGRDFARLVHSGMEPTNTTKHVDEWLANEYEVYDETDEVTKRLEEMLRDHFGI